MKIALGSDHGGFPLKKEIARHLTANGIDFKDFGTFEAEPAVDYPDFVKPVAKAVREAREDEEGKEGKEGRESNEDGCELGILVCGTGIGVSIAANKVHGIRAALCTDCYMAKMSREHNDANILALGGRVIGTGLALEIVDVFLKSTFLGGRHATRVEKIMKLEILS